MAPRPRARRWVLGAAVAMLLPALTTGPAAASAPASPGVLPAAVSTVGDFTGDGHPDLIARHATSKTLYLYRGNGTGGFQTGSTQIGWNWGAVDTIISPGDFTGDGRPDLIARHATSKTLYLYRGNGTGGFQTGSTQIGWNWGAVDTIISP
ncbi:VCBS repeat-containing protein, partial [Georgenia daeguensis]